MSDKVTRCSIACTRIGTCRRRLELYFDGIYVFECLAKHSIVVATRDELKMSEVRHRLDTGKNAPPRAVLPSQLPFQRNGQAQQSRRCSPQQWLDLSVYAGKSRQTTKQIQKQKSTMPDLIDYSFLSDLEGGRTTSGYVPAATVSKSGVTIATGFDLGQRSEADLKRLGLPTNLIEKLKPYLGAKKEDAKKLLDATPLTITSSEAESIDKAVKSAHLATVKIKYDAASSEKSFIDLPAEAQTVIASVSFQYGKNLDAAAPKFWTAVTKQDWTEAAKILRNFGDVFPTRRKKEAALLENIK